MLVNVSRLGKSGTGMWQYSINFLDVLSRLGVLSGIICSCEHEARLKGYEVELILVPSWVTNTSRVSQLRPLLWFLYSFWLSVKLSFRSTKDTLVSTTHHAVPFIKNQVITIHDLRPYDYPDSIMQKVYFHLLLPRALMHCNHILTVSECVKGKIANYYNYPAECISVIYNAVDTNVFSACTEKKGYLLAVGASWRHKNIDSLLKFSDTWIEDYDLVIIAGHTDYVRMLKNYVEMKNLDGKVSFRHNVAFSDLITLYQHASALIYPSLDEGFGIPPIEALSCLTPVVVSDIPIFHEVLSDAALYVNPNVADSWIRIFSVLGSSAYSSRAWQQKALYCASKYNKKLMSSMVSAWLKRISL